LSFVAATKHAQWPQPRPIPPLFPFRGCRIWGLGVCDQWAW